MVSGVIDYGRLTVRQVVTYYAAKGRGYRTASRRYGLCNTLGRAIRGHIADHRQRRHMRQSGLTEHDVDTLLSGEQIRRDVRGSQ